MSSTSIIDVSPALKRTIMVSFAPSPKAVSVPLLALKLAVTVNNLRSSNHSNPSFLDSGRTRFLFWRRLSKGSKCIIDLEKFVNASLMRKIYARSRRYRHAISPPQRITSSRPTWSLRSISQRTHSRAKLKAKEPAARNTIAFQDVGLRIEALPTHARLPPYLAVQ